MPIVKRIKRIIVDKEEVINISLDSNGLFSADIPLNVRAVVSDTIEMAIFPRSYVYYRDEGTLELCS